MRAHWTRRVFPLYAYLCVLLIPFFFRLASIGAGEQDQHLGYIVPFEAGALFILAASGAKIKRKNFHRLLFGIGALLVAIAALRTITVMPKIPFLLFSCLVLLLITVVGCVFYLVPHDETDGQRTQGAMRYFLKYFVVGALVLYSLMYLGMRLIPPRSHSVQQMELLLGGWWVGSAILVCVALVLLYWMSVVRRWGTT